MSNLRSDCRALVADREPGDVWRTHIERLCHQIDDVEERWHAAERLAMKLMSSLIRPTGPGEENYGTHAIDPPLSGDDYDTRYFPSEFDAREFLRAAYGGPLQSQS